MLVAAGALSLWSLANLLHLAKPIHASELFARSVSETHNASCYSASGDYVESTLMALSRLSSINDLVINSFEENRSNLLLSNLKNVFLAWRKEPNKAAPSDAIGNVMKLLGLHASIDSEPRESRFSIITEFICTHLASLLPNEPGEPNFIYAKIAPTYRYFPNGSAPQLNWQGITAFPPASLTDAFVAGNGLPHEVLNCKTGNSYRLKVVLCAANSSLGYFPYESTWYPLSGSLTKFPASSLNQEEIVCSLNTFGGLLFFELQSHVQKQAQDTLKRLDQALKQDSKSLPRTANNRPAITKSKSHSNFNSRGYLAETLSSNSPDGVKLIEYPPHELLSVPNCISKLPPLLFAKLSPKEHTSEDPYSGLELDLHSSLHFDSIKAKHQGPKSQPLPYTTHELRACIEDLETSSSNAAPPTHLRKKHILPMREHQLMYEQANLASNTSSMDSHKTIGHAGFMGHSSLEKMKDSGFEMGISSSNGSHSTLHESPYTHQNTDYSPKQDLWHKRSQGSHSDRHPLCRRLKTENELEASKSSEDHLYSLSKDGTNHK